MIDKEKIAKPQIARMAQMLGFPRGDREALGELVIALQVASRDEIAVACIDHFLSFATSDTRCPMPADIRRWIYERQFSEDTEAKQRTRDCPHCHGDGVVRVVVGLYSGVATCVCRGGPKSTRKAPESESQTEAGLKRITGNQKS